MSHPDRLPSALSPLLCAPSPAVVGPGCWTLPPCRPRPRAARCSHGQVPHSSPQARRAPSSSHPCLLAGTKGHRLGQSCGRMMQCPDQGPRIACALPSLGRGQTVAGEVGVPARSRGRRIWPQQASSAGAGGRRCPPPGGDRGHLPSGQGPGSQPPAPPCRSVENPTQPKWGQVAAGGKASTDGAC